MKGISFSLLRIIFALIIGLVIILWPDAAINYLIITIGVLFLIPSLISIINYLANKSKSGNIPFPLEGIGSLMFGLFLIIIPGFFADILTIILGFILILGGLQQITSLVRAKKWRKVSFGFFVIPTLILLAGIAVIANPSGARETTLMVVGVTAIVYAIFELINWIKFKKQTPLDDHKVYIDVD
jgi:membrane protein HdeD